MGPLLRDGPVPLRDGPCCWAGLVLDSAGKDSSREMRRITIILEPLDWGLGGCSKTVDGKLKILFQQVFQEFDFLMHIVK